MFTCLCRSRSLVIDLPAVNIPNAIMPPSCRDFSAVLGGGARAYGTVGDRVGSGYSRAVRLRRQVLQVIAVCLTRRCLV